MNKSGRKEEGAREGESERFPLPAMRGSTAGPPSRSGSELEASPGRPGDSETRAGRRRRTLSRFSVSRWAVAAETFFRWIHPLPFAAAPPFRQCTQGPSFRRDNSADPLSGQQPRGNRGSSPAVLSAERPLASRWNEPFPPNRLHWNGPAVRLYYDTPASPTPGRRTPRPGRLGRTRTDSDGEFGLHCLGFTQVRCPSPGYRLRTMHSHGIHGGTVRVQLPQPRGSDRRRLGVMVKFFDSNHGHAVEKFV